MTDMTDAIKVQMIIRLTLSKIVHDLQEIKII